tara:strand:- start:444 stop:863 length:420 start_codon:yes stop_codon:yes gene_type:complete
MFCYNEFKTGIVFKRELGSGGASWHADNLYRHEDLLDYAYRIAEAIDLIGSCNIQVRKSSDGVRLLEINPRFSSLGAARTICGFKDLDWSLNLALKRKNPERVQNYKRIRFRRYLHELVDFGDGFEAISDWSPHHIKAT